MEKEQYIAELSKLLGFMSSWDRKAEIARYSRQFDGAEDAKTVIKRLGTPTRVAVELAKDYVPTPPPEREDGEPEPPPPAEPVRVAAVPAAPPPQPEPRRELNPGGMIGFFFFAVFIGAPVGLLLICVGFPFIAAGAGVIGAVTVTIFQTVGSFHLLSDLLTVGGAGLAVCAVALVVLWLGIWISISLLRLWIGRVLGPVANRMCLREE